MTQGRATPFQIKVGMMISHDYHFIFHSLPLIYQDADAIVLAVDRKRLTWAGNPFQFDEGLFDKIRKMDPLGKISIYEDDFFVPGLSAMECDTRERNLLAKRLGEGGWHVQVDTDEYFIDFAGFVASLRTLERRAQTEKFMIRGHWLTLFKRLDSGFLAIDGRDETFPLATNAPNFNAAREIFDPGYVRWDSDAWVVHESWARSPEEIQQKVSNWGHKDDFPVENFLSLWNFVDEVNYRYIANFHPLNGPDWPALNFIQGDRNAVVAYQKAKIEAQWIAAQNLRQTRTRWTVVKAIKEAVKLFLPPILYQWYEWIRRR